MEYRLNRYISGSGYCSRREADRLIEEGHVTINGKRASIGMRVLPGQKVKVRGELIKNDLEPVYIAFNKPVGIVSTTDTSEKNNIVDYISHEQRIFPIGRLDKDSQGLILLTNDGDIVNKILRVGNNHRKEYVVKVNKPITKDFLTKMAQGVPILDRVTRRCEIVEINPYTFQISLIQGLNRQIRRMCEYFDYEVLKLERIQIMNIQLGSLGQGNWRNLTSDELEGLFDLLDKSKDIVQSKKPANSNKAMNKALQEYDIKTNYRKAGMASKPGTISDKSTKDSKIEKASKVLRDTRISKESKVSKTPKAAKSSRVFSEAKTKDRSKRNNERSASRAGKSKPTSNKTQGRRNSRSRRGQSTSR
ncbi:MAG: 23S rRNA pseudouridine(2604) synthase RluF [Tannerella sp.]|jgi:23S rRNA pseudouridine2604 synthase|nr:23S rRNA pseudouridine(2604) synthase RluF [Tannerella sp.]